MKRHAWGQVNAVVGKARFARLVNMDAVGVLDLEANREIGGPRGVFGADLDFRPAGPVGAGKFGEIRTFLKAHCAAGLPVIR
jgi:hypothetical protein